MCHDLHGTSLNSGVGPSGLAVAASIHGISGALIFRAVQTCQVGVSTSFRGESLLVLTLAVLAMSWQKNGSLVSRMVARNDKANTKKAQKAPCTPCTVTV